MPRNYVWLASWHQLCAYITFGLKLTKLYELDFYCTEGTQSTWCFSVSVSCFFIAPDLLSADITLISKKNTLSQFSHSIRNYWKVTNTVSDVTSFKLCYKNMFLYCPPMSAKYPTHTVTETCGEVFLKFNLRCISEHTNFIHKTNIHTLVLWM